MRLDDLLAGRNALSPLQLLQERRQGIYGEVAGVGGSLGQESQILNEVILAKSGGLVDTFSHDQFGQRRSTCNRRNATSRQKTQLHDASLLNAGAQPQDVAARGIFELR